MFIFIIIYYIRYRYYRSMKLLYIIYYNNYLGISAEHKIIIQTSVYPI